MPVAAWVHPPPPPPVSHQSDVKQDREEGAGRVQDAEALSPPSTPAPICQGVNKRVTRAEERWALCPGTWKKGAGLKNSRNCSLTSALLKGELRLEQSQAWAAEGQQPGQKGRRPEAGEGGGGWSRRLGMRRPSSGACVPHSLDQLPPVEPELHPFLSPTAGLWP